MTVQFRTGWSGHAAGSVATLDAASEAQVIAAGFARAYAAAGADSRRGSATTRGMLGPDVQRRTVFGRRSASGLVAKAPAQYLGYSCLQAGGTITIYDSLGPSGTVVVATTTLAVGEFPAWKALAIGCYVVLSGPSVVHVNVDAYW